MGGSHDKAIKASLAVGAHLCKNASMYRGEKKSVQILLSYSQAGPGRKAKQDQEDISRNHVPRLCKQRPTPRLQRSLLMARARETQYSRLCYSLLLSFSIPNSYPG